MTTITEDYVSFETAKLLKEKGFDIPVRTYYENDDYEIVLDNEIIFGSTRSWNNSPMGHISAPTQTMAMKWLREVHNKHCDIGYDLDLYWFFRIIDLKELKEHFDYSELKYYHTENETGFDTYEEAVEAGIKYCLENLI